MSFQLGTDLIVDRLLFGYGAKSNGTPLYVLTQLQDTTINISADSKDITDKDGNLVYRKYTGKTGEVSAVNAYMNLKIIETLSATDAEVASEAKGVVMPMITTVKAGEALDITNYVSNTVAVNGLSANGAIGKEYTLGSSNSETEFAITEIAAVYTLTTDTAITAGKTYYTRTGDGTEASPYVYGVVETPEAADISTYYELTTPASATLTLPANPDEVQYIVKYKKTVYSGAKIVNRGDKFPKSHELFFKALVVDLCNREEFRAAIIRIPAFMPSPEMELKISGGDDQTLNYKGSIMMDVCSADKTMFEVYYIDEMEDVE